MKLAKRILEKIKFDKLGMLRLIWGSLLSSAGIMNKEITVEIKIDKIPEFNVANYI